jgi:pimeloyl-ACP methyl ester carboxylesterase
VSHVAPTAPLADDVHLAYDVHGTLGAEVPVVLLHAFPLDRSMWVPVAERLAAATVPAVAIDLPGLGASPLPDGTPDLASSARGVAGVLDALGIARAVVVGVSMGGYVALTLLRDRPERLAGLALVDTKAGADGDEARANRERIAAAVEGDAGTRALAPMLDGLLGATTRAQRPDVVERVRAGVAAARVEGVAWSQRAMAARPDYAALLPTATVPSAVVVGAQDALTPPSIARATAQALADSVLTVLPSAGHLSPLEDPEGVAATLLALQVRVRLSGWSAGG